VFCNDTITVTMEVIAKKETSKPDRGVVVFKHRVHKQTGELVMEMDKVRLIRRKV
jgi:acyl dehydratase